MPSIDANILDFTTRAIGFTDALFDFALLNGIGITDDVAAGTPVALPSVQYDVKPLALESVEAAYELQEIKERQTTADFTCQFFGTLESLFDMAVLNGIGITQDVAPGTVLKAVSSYRRTVDFYRNSIRDIVTGVTNRIKPGGIGYMQIQNDFIVS